MASREPFDQDGRSSHTATFQGLCVQATYLISNISVLLLESSQLQFQCTL